MDNYGTLVLKLWREDQGVGMCLRRNVCGFILTTIWH